MEPLKKEILDTISKLPDDVEVDEVMYRLYVLDKVRKGREDVKEKRTLSAEELRREIDKW